MRRQKGLSILCLFLLASCKSGMSPDTGPKAPVTADETETPSQPIETQKADPPAQESRDMIEIPNATMYEEYLVGGQPGSQDYAAMRKEGYTTVIDLRLADEDGARSNQADAEGAGMSYVRIPVAGAEGLDRANVEAFARALADASGPVVVHCKSGNRVGAMFALKAHWLDGRSARDALEAGKEAGLTSLEETVAGLLGLAE